MKRTPRVTLFPRQIISLKNGLTHSSWESIQKTGKSFWVATQGTLYKDMLLQPARAVSTNTALQIRRSNTKM